MDYCKMVLLNVKKRVDPAAGNAAAEHTEERGGVSFFHVHFSLK